MTTSGEYRLNPVHGYEHPDLEQLAREDAELQALEERTLTAMRRVFLTPEGAQVLEWLRVVCGAADRDLQRGFRGLDPLEMAASRALRALYREIEWMVKEA